MNITATLTTQLQSPDPAQQRTALDWCLTTPQLIADMLPLVIPLTNSSFESVRESAVAICERNDQWPVTLVQPLADLLSVEQGDAAYWCATLLGRFGEAATPAIPALVAALQRVTLPAAQQRVIAALGRIGPAAQIHRPALEPFVKHSDPHLARTAKQVLSEWD